MDTAISQHMQDIICIPPKKDRSDFLGLNNKKLKKKKKTNLESISLIFIYLFFFSFVPGEHEVYILLQTPCFAIDRVAFW